MNLLERYLAKIILMTTLLVFLGLVSLYSFFSLIRVTQFIGRGSYVLPDALHYVLFTLPGLSYEVFPAAVLLGTLLGVSYMHNHRETIAIRCAGVSHIQIITAIVKMGMVLSLFVFIIGEYVAPVTERIAIRHQNVALYDSLTLDIKNEVWIKEKNFYANIRSIRADKTLSGISIYSFKNGKMNEAMYAQEAVYIDDKWLLKDIKVTRFNENSLETYQIPEVVWDVPLKLNLVDILSEEIKNLSAAELYQYANYLDQNQLDSSPYFLQFWQKITAPFTLLVMIFLAYPFAISDTRANNMGFRIVIGVILGLSFSILNKISAEFGLLYHFPPFISAVFFTVLTFLASVFLIKKMR